MALPAQRRILLTAFQQIQWTEDGVTHDARWQSERGASPPQQVQLADDRLNADTAYGLACQGVALLWRGDFQNARQLLNALGNRADRHRRLPPRSAAAAATTMAEAFHRERQARAQRARTLSALLIELDADYRSALRRAPDVSAACSEALGAGQGPLVLSLRELLGMIGAHEWRVRGIELPAVNLRIHAHYGVFAPLRHEYVELVAQAPLPAALAAHNVAFDIGTGTGVLAAVLARRGIGQVLATDVEPRALA
ncbi:MAG: methyltransferase, partial [Xanthomonadales bacterium]|nr:methyltransferase [Xanthomonadales bacterium]